MSSVDTPAPAPRPAAKVCTICGMDVSKVKRQKDRTGRYFCEPCAEETRRQQQEDEQKDSDAEPASAVPKEPDLLFCEACGTRAPAEYMILHRAHVLCRDCKKSGAVKVTLADITVEMGDIPNYVSTTNTIIILSIFATFLPVVGSVMQIVTMKRLMRLSGREDEWGWTVAAGIPLFGLIALKLMANHAGKAVHKSVGKINLLIAHSRSGIGNC
jgi:hypothetical protein